MNKKARIVVLASGSGTNAEVIFNYFRNHPLIEVVLLVCNNPEAQVLERAQKFGIPVRVIRQKGIQRRNVHVGFAAAVKG